MKYIEKTSYRQIKERIKAVNKPLYDEIEKLSLGDDLPLYLAKYPFGTKPLKKGQLQIINDDGHEVSITDKSLEQTLKEDLGYGPTFPMGLVLSKRMEIYTSLEGRDVPWAVFETGSIFALSAVLVLNTGFDEGDYWECTSGGKSIFSTEKLSDARQIKRLAACLGGKLSKPSGYEDHRRLFFEIGQLCKSDWCVEVLYFTKDWLPETDALNWRAFKCFLHEYIWDALTYHRQRFLQDIVYSQFVDHCKNIAPNVFVNRLVKHLVAVSNSSLPGFKFSTTDEAMPLSLITEVLTENYDMRGHYPLLVELDTKNESLYYSFAYHISSEALRSRHKSSKKKGDIDEVLRLIDRLSEIPSELGIDLSKNQYAMMRNFLQTSVCAYHNWSNSISDAIKNPANIELNDESLVMISGLAQEKGLSVSTDSPFFNGLIQLTRPRKS